jgi:hypothetical protein
VKPRRNWWLLENVPGAPSIDVTGYSHQRIDIDARDLGGATVTASREPAVS